jgi:poly-gamma-glutamate system protein
LIILAVVSYSLYLWAEHSRVLVKQEYYTEKMEASQLMARAIGILRDYRLQKGVRIDEINDPNLTALIGPQNSLITTEFGHLEERITSLNPNMAAMAVELMKEAGLQAGDPVAVALTGSNPGVNLAFYAAMTVLRLKPTIITSVGSASWGANNPDFTWLDMERVVYDRGVFPFRSVAASLGGGNDMGMRMSERGREMAVQDIASNGVAFINEPNLRSSIDAWESTYHETLPDSKYKTFINVGEGEASLGHVKNGDLIPSGFNPRIPPKNYPAQGLIHRFSDGGSSILNIYNVSDLADRFDLPKAPIPTPPVGEGDLFYAMQYDETVAVVAVAVVFALLIALLALDARLFRMRDEGVDPDTLM